MTRKILAPHCIAFAWGLAEATAFFIVPDVYIGYRGLRSVRAALTASFYALGGALIGGVVMYEWALHTDVAMTFVQHVPAITSTVMQTARNGYTHHGITALFIGMAEGVPYKVYAVLAPARHISLCIFIVVSVVARLSRFAATGLATAGLSRLLGRWICYRVRLGIFVAFWVIFYIGYSIAHQ